MDALWQTEEYRDLIKRCVASTDLYLPNTCIIDMHGDSPDSSLLFRGSGLNASPIFGGQTLSAVFDVAYQTVFNVRFVTTIGGTEYTLDGSSINQCSYESQSTSGSTFSFGDFIGKTAEITFFDFDGDYDDVVFDGAEGVLAYSVRRSNGTYYWVTMGSFIVDNSKRTNGTVWLSMSDYRSKFDKIHTGSFVGSPVLLIGILESACTSAGVTLGTIIDDFFNLEYAIVSNASTLMTELPNTTDLQLIQWVAQACGAFAIIGRDNKLYLKWYEDVTPNYFVQSKYISVGQSVADYTISVTGVSWTTTDGTKYTNGTTSYSLDVSNNPLTFANYSSLLTGIASNVVGFEYVPIDMRWIGDPALDVGDIIVVSDKKGNIFSVPIMQLSNKNLLSQTIKSVGESTQKNASVSVSSSVSASIEDVRTIAKFGEIKAERVTTGKLQSTNGKTYFNLDGDGTLHTEGEIEALGFTGTISTWGTKAWFSNQDFYIQLFNLYTDFYDPVLFHTTHNRASYDTHGTTTWDTDSTCLYIQDAIAIIAGKTYRINGGGTTFLNEFTTLNDVYPVGSVYYTTKTNAQFSPVTDWGGSWTYTAGTPNKWERTA